jgi:hypothetical protein
MTFTLVQRRRPQRKAANTAAWIEKGNNHLLERCTLINVSDKGAWLSINDVHDLPLHFKLHLVRGTQESVECRVIWRKRNDVGVEFV